VKRPLVLGLLWLLLLLVGATPMWLRLPEPARAQAIRAAEPVDAPATAVALPVSWPARGETARLRFTLPPGASHLFIPLASQRVRVWLDGRLVTDSGERNFMFGVIAGVTQLIRLPQAAPAGGGARQLEIDVHAQGLTRAYLSPVYAGTATELGPYYRLRVFVYEYLRMMVLAAQILLALVVLVVWLYRPREPLFGWLPPLLLLSMLDYTGMLGDVFEPLVDAVLYAAILGSASAFVLLIVTLWVAGRSPPRWLRIAAFAVPLGSAAVEFAGWLPPRMVLLLFSAPLSIACVTASLAVVCWSVARRRSLEAWLLLIPLLLLVAAGLHDLLMVRGVLAGPLYMNVYYRAMVVIGIAMILMRRLGLSLQRLDEANDVLTARLAEREAELNRLHAVERGEAARRVRGEERHRLTVDLHDGLSGHLASIIALAEREGSTPIEHTAREALGDLRLVIHSLNIGDRELVAALSGLRERLEPQLKRLGIALEWSMARLPEISGVTPTHALHALRIVQEAVTNAVRHGPASRIAVRGGTGETGGAEIVIDNDGAPYAPAGAGGAGVNNMTRRAELLGGSLRVQALPDGTRVTLALPPRLSP
jgi:signal transduction histidine kinase